MAVTPSATSQLGTQLPTFSLPDTSGNDWSPPSDSAGTLVVFICNHCPYVVHVADVLCEVHGQCEDAGIAMCGINSNDIIAYPDDSPEAMGRTASNCNWTFPYLFDASQDVARQFGATCTPDVFLYDREGKLYYRGQFDGTRPKDGATSDGCDLKNAIDEMVQGNPSPKDQHPSIGCSIKWKP